LALVLGLALLSAIALRGLYPFLALNAPNPRGFLIIDSGTPETALRECVAEFNRHHYDKVFVVGGPIDQGRRLTPYRFQADRSLVTLQNLGLSADVLEAVSQSDLLQDRAYACAVALRHRWRAQATAPTDINLVSVGAHARRCRLLFQRALGRDVSVGILALCPEDYDARHWWRSSQGFRSVTGELIAYGYARLVFWKFPRA
jgi:hypothetical protein